MRGLVQWTFENLEQESTFLFRGVAQVVGPLTESNVERIFFGKEPGDGSAGVMTMLGMRGLEYLEPKGEAI